MVQSCRAPLSIRMQLVQCTISTSIETWLKGTIIILMCDTSSDTAKQIDNSIPTQFSTYSLNWVVYTHFLLLLVVLQTHE